MKRITRRTFTQQSAATLALAGTQVGSGERIRVGFIGVANRGGKLIDAFKPHSDAEIVAICDVDARALAGAGKRIGAKVDAYGDFRRILDREDIDAVVIATPDHWHALQTVMACDAGKDVYVEKPLSVTVHEGRRMVAAARRNKRVVQVGTHRRSSALYGELAKRAQAGDFGKICVGRAYRTNNMYPKGIGRSKPSAPPAELDWNMWLGPRPERPYQDNITPYRFRWWQQFSSQMGNWGVHYLDLIRWCTGEEAPASVCAMGGRYAVDDDRTIPDTMQVCFEFASGRLAVFGQYETSGHRAFPDGELELRGTRATIYSDYRHYEVVPERGGQFQEAAPRTKAETVKGGDDNKSLTVRHARNFLDCIRTREKPVADIEIGHRSTTMSLIANISLAVGQRLDWNARDERFTNSEAANRLLHYEYRAPWKLG